MNKKEENNSGMKRKQAEMLRNSRMKKKRRKRKKKETDRKDESDQRDKKQEQKQRQEERQQGQKKTQDHEQDRNLYPRETWWMTRTEGNTPNNVGAETQEENKGEQNKIIQHNTRREGEGREGR
jgi:hypothetical protein